MENIKVIYLIITFKIEQSNTYSFNRFFTFLFIVQSHIFFLPKLFILLFFALKKFKVAN